VSIITEVYLRQTAHPPGAAAEDHLLFFPVPAAMNGLLADPPAESVSVSMAAP